MNNLRIERINNIYNYTYSNLNNRFAKQGNPNSEYNNLLKEDIKKLEKKKKKKN